MERTDRIIIKGDVPSKSNCYKVITLHGHGSLAKQRILKEYEEKFYLQCPLRGMNLEKFFKLEVDIFYSSNRKDLDNGFKILLDCLQKCGAIKNDRQCVEIHARKLVDKDNPRIEFTLEELI